MYQSPLEGQFKHSFLGSVLRISDSVDLGWGLRTCISDKFLGERTIALGESAIISIFVAFTHQHKVLSKLSWMEFLQILIFIMLLKP